MKIEKELVANKLTVKVEGRLDTMTAPELEKEVKEAMANATELVFDLKDLEYISSAGLRVLFSLFKLAKQKMVIRNANEIVMEVFEVTGFADVFHIE
ncbi:MAG: STAS domain-containing protein [Suilimivivens sp.]